MSMTSTTSQWGPASVYTRIGKQRSGKANSLAARKEKLAVVNRRACQKIQNRDDLSLALKLLAGVDVRVAYGLLGVYRIDEGTKGSIELLQKSLRLLTTKMNAEHVKQV